MKIFKLILIELVFIVSFFLAAELAAQVCFYLKNGCTLKESFLYDNDKDLIYKINNSYKGKQGKYYLGIRKECFEEDKKGKFRIVCLGASTTFGHAQFDNEKVWTEILERLLGREEYEVLNAGVPGYGSSNLTARLKRDIVKLAPDMVIIFTGWNLAGSLRSKYAWVPDNVYFKKQGLLKRINNFLIDKSIIYLKSRQFIISKIKEPKNDMIEQIYRDELPLVERDLEEMISICRDNNIVPLLVKYPARDYSYKRYRDTIKMIERVALRDNVYLADCAHYFESLPQEIRDGYFSDMAHFSDTGSEKIAEIIYSSLIESGYINKEKTYDGL